MGFVERIRNFLDQSLRFEIYYSLSVTYDYYRPKLSILIIRYLHWDKSIGQIH